MSAEQVLFARVGAARVMLERAVGTPMHGSLSRIQAAAIMETLRAHTLGAQWSASFAARVLEVAWAGEDGQAVLSALTPSGLQSVGRRCVQDWNAVVNYCSKEFAWFVGHFTRAVRWVGG